MCMCFYIYISIRFVLEFKFDRFVVIKTLAIAAAADTSFAYDDVVDDDGGSLGRVVRKKTICADPLCTMCAAYTSTSLAFRSQSYCCFYC